MRLWAQQRALVFPSQVVSGFLSFISCTSRVSVSKVSLSPRGAWGRGSLGVNGTEYTPVSAPWQRQGTGREQRPDGAARPVELWVWPDNGNPGNCNLPSCTTQIYWAGPPPGEGEGSRSSAPDTSRAHATPTPEPGQADKNSRNSGTSSALVLRDYPWIQASSRRNHTVL